VYLEPLIAALVAFTVSYITVHVVSKLRRPLSILTVDVHKPTPVVVPKIGGTCLLTSSIAVVVALALLAPNSSLTFKLAQIYAPTLIVGVLGLLDDILGLRPVARVLATLAVAIAVSCLTTVSDVVSVVGKIHSKIIIQVLAIASILVFSNAVNMLDVMNGIVPISTCIVLTALVLCLALRGEISEISLLLPLIAQYIPLALYNKYPARVLNGNVGSYFTGALLGVLACVTGMYLELTLACIPYIVNGLLILASTRGKVLSSGRLGVDRPIRCMSGKLTPNLSPNAALSLVRLVVLSGADSEPKVVNKIIQLFVISSLLAIAASCLGAVLS